MRSRQGMPPCFFFRSRAFRISGGRQDAPLSRKGGGGALFLWSRAWICWYVGSMQSDTVECKPTMWFTGRAVIMALMFLGFGVYFYYDASTGYPQKNLEFFMHKAFVDAGAVFDREVSGPKHKKPCRRHTRWQSFPPHNSPAPPCLWSWHKRLSCAPKRQPPCR